MMNRTSFTNSITLTLTLICAAMLGGCGVIPWMASGVGGGEKTYSVEAQYRGLDNRSVAVMVSADEVTLFQQPNAPKTVARAITSLLAQHIPGIELTNPAQIAKYQVNNPYWTTLPYSQLIEKMGVDRLVLVDLVDYRTHEPGNAHVWRGVVTGNVLVIEADSPDPDNPAFFSTVRAEFPEDTTVGVVNADAQTIQLGMVSLFARRAGGLFYDHEVTK